MIESVREGAVVWDELIEEKRFIEILAPCHLEDKDGFCDKAIARLKKQFQTAPRTEI